MDAILSEAFYDLIQQWLSDTHYNSVQLEKYKNE